MLELICAVGFACAKPQPAPCQVNTYRVRSGDSPVQIIEDHGNKARTKITDQKGHMIFMREHGSDTLYRGVRVDETVTVESCAA